MNHAAANKDNQQILGLKVYTFFKIYNYLVLVKQECKNRKEGNLNWILLGFWRRRNSLAFVDQGLDSVTHQTAGPWDTWAWSACPGLLLENAVGL